MPKMLPEAPDVRGKIVGRLESALKHMQLICESYNLAHCKFLSASAALLLHLSNTGCKFTSSNRKNRMIFLRDVGGRLGEVRASVSEKYLARVVLVRGSLYI
jgi:hypothetical protein